MRYLTLRELSLSSEKVLMRVDFNVPLQNSEVFDDSRIQAALPSIQYCLDQGASLILMSHLGRPNGRVDQKYSLAPCAKVLSQFLSKDVYFASPCVGEETEEYVKKMAPGGVVLLENLRFFRAEEEPEVDPHFTKLLAKLGTIYVNDAFGTAHRAHSSTSFIAKEFPSDRVGMGFLMEKEVKKLSELVTLPGPERPYYAIIGGAKISSKISFLQSLLHRVDRLFIGGAMAFTFLRAQGISIGNSLFEEDCIDVAARILKEAKPGQLVLPDDFIISNGMTTSVALKQEGIQKGWKGVDIGPKTIEKWGEMLNEAKSIFWNGPLGKFEVEEFAIGTCSIGKALSNSKSKVYIGGGDSLAAINKLGLQDSFYHLSTGGGAALEFIEFGHLPAIDALLY
jgi:phosphoglycerate kinase